MKVLLDTNIIIHREAARLKEGSNIGLLFRWMDKLRYEKWIHPLTREELAKNKNSDTFQTLNVKLESYNELKTEAPLSEALLRIQEQYDKDDNDRNDTRLLAEVYENRVNMLVTEDDKIHEKASDLGITDKVRKIEDFLHEVTSANPELTDYKVLSIQKTYLGKLDINDKFFNSFKEDYPQFESWFSQKANETGYVSLDEKGKIIAFLYLKIENDNENYSDIYPIFARTKRLKIGTFKVISTGYKLGERFLKIIFDNALGAKVKEIYVTIFEDDAPSEKADLVKLLQDWGFYRHGEKTSSAGKEGVYVRDFTGAIKPSNIKHSYPFISNKGRKFIVPIYPEYHTELLPDSILTNEQKKDFVNNKAHRNALHKVYISRGVNRDLKKGDIIVFYRTGGRYKSVVTTIGIVDNVVTDISHVEKFISLCGARSVFSRDKLIQNWNKPPRPFIVNFLYVHSFSPPFLNMEKLIELGIIKNVHSAPRGFEPLSDDQFNLLIKETNAQNIIVD